MGDVLGDEGTLVIVAIEPPLAIADNQIEDCWGYDCLGPSFLSVGLIIGADIALVPSLLLRRYMRAS